MIKIKRTRAPYWHLLPLENLEYLPATDIYAIKTPFNVLMEYQQREKKEGATKIVQEIVEFIPGIVVFRKKREANKIEREQWKDLTPSELEKFQLEKRGEKIFVYIAERIESLWHAARQLARHAISTYLGKKIRLNKEAVFLLGSYQRMNCLATMMSKLNAELTEVLSKATFPEKEELSQKAQKRMLAISNFLNTFLSTPRTAKVKAEWEKVLEEKKLTKSAYRLAQAGVKALEKAASDLEIVAKLAKKAQKRIELDEKYKNILKEIYQGLGKVSEKLQKMLSEGKFVKERLEEVEKKVRDFLGKASEIKFDPYLNEAISTREFQGLSRVSEHIQEANFKTVFNLCQQALKKIEKFVIGEVPGAKEIQPLRGEAG